MQFRSELQKEISTPTNRDIETPEQQTSSSEAWSSTFENTAPSPSRLNQKKTHPQLPRISAEVTKKSTKNRQSALAGALGTPVPISAINEAKQMPSEPKKKQFSIESPTNK